jgi:dihydroorotase
VQSSGLLLKALQYVKAIDKTIIQLPDDQSISANGLMNESVVSTRLGLPGKPAIAEELMINRDIELAKYTGSKIHFTGVSTAKGIRCIEKAKAEGVQVSCSVTPAHLCFSDEDLIAYDTNLKLSPPLRTGTDREALQQAVLNGTVDCIASHHLPQHVDHKVVEFEYAKNGMISLETAFAVVQTCLPLLSLEQLVHLFSIHPRRLFAMPLAVIATGQPACISLLQPSQTWTPERFASKSRNSPFVGKTLTGRPVGIINRDKVFLRPL